MKLKIFCLCLVMVSFWNVQIGAEHLDIEALASNAPLDSTHVAALFVDADSGEELFAHNPDEIWIPASNTKLFTTAAALYYLGADYKYKTTLYTTGKITGDSLDGDLIVRGRGDPAISARFYPDSNDPRAVFYEWGDILAEMGISTIKGDIIADDRYFDDQYFHSYWYPRSRANWYQAEVSALSFNDNCVDITFMGGGELDQPAQFSIEPPTRYVEIDNRIKTHASSRSISFHRNDRSNIITANGFIGLNQNRKRYATVYNPALYFVTVLSETLEEFGIKVEGKPVAIREIENPGFLDNDLFELYEHSSPPLSDLIYVINQRSQNLFSELLLKTLGKEVLGEGSFDKGALAVEKFLEKKGIAQEGFNMIDGSGLSNRNRFSPRMVVALLQYQRSRDDWHVYFDSLPQGGRTGSLRSRFRNSDQKIEKGPFIYGKTGYINRVVTLSGIMTGYDGDDILYSIFLNNFDCTPAQARSFADKLAVSILSHTLNTAKEQEVVLQ